MSSFNQALMPTINYFKAPKGSIMSNLHIIKQEITAYGTILGHYTDTDHNTYVIENRVLWDAQPIYGMPLDVEHCGMVKNVIYKWQEINQETQEIIENAYENIKKVLVHIHEESGETTIQKFKAELQEILDRDGEELGTNQGFMNLVLMQYQRGYQKMRPIRITCADEDLQSFIVEAYQRGLQRIGLYDELKEEEK